MLAAQQQILRTDRLIREQYGANNDVAVTIRFANRARTLSTLLLPSSRCVHYPVQLGPSRRTFSGGPTFSGNRRACQSALLQHDLPHWAAADSFDAGQQLPFPAHPAAAAVATHAGVRHRCSIVQTARWAGHPGMSVEPAGRPRQAVWPFGIFAAAIFGRSF